MALTKALCCFNSKTAMYLEKTNLIITTIAILFNIFKLCIIPWGATSYSMEFLAVFNFTFLAVNLVFVFFFFMLRLKSMLNDSNYRKSLSICYFMIFISLLCFLFEILLMFFGLEDLYYYTGTYYASTDESVKDFDKLKFGDIRYINLFDNQIKSPSIFEKVINYKSLKTFFVGKNKFDEKEINKNMNKEYHLEQLKKKMKK